MYAKKIEDLYADADKMPTSAPLDISAPEGDVDITGSVSINRFIHNAVSQIVGSSTFQDEEDLFVRGLLDSLQALRSTRILKQTFVIPELEITTLYTNPSVKSLTEAIVRHSSLHESSRTSSRESESKPL